MKKKKFLCFFLVLMLCFSSTISVYASSGSHGGGGTSIDETEDNTSLAEKLGSSLGTIVGKLFVEPFEFATDFTESVNSGLDSVISEHLPDWLEKGYVHATVDGYEFLPECTKVINDYLQKHIQILDGYYVITPCGVNTWDYLVHYYDMPYDDAQLLKSYMSPDSCTTFKYNDYPYGMQYVSTPGTLFYIKRDSDHWTYTAAYSSDDSNVLSRLDFNSYKNSKTIIFKKNYARTILGKFYYDSSLTNYLNELASYCSGAPFKVFQSKYALTKYLSDGRSYLPEVPSTVKIPKKYIDDPTLLPDITYNVDKSNKTENIIQNEYNTIINNYITNLGGSSSGGTSGGDSGNTGGGSSSGGSSGGGSNITDTELYDFLTKLWNESDKKFDKMIDLLETNNKYQKKLVDSLNDIKAILVTEAVFNAFKDRSSQTADKAKDKFPTSIPWDVAMVINAMSAEPEQLKFSLPIQVKSIGINETIDIDLSSEEWEKLAKTCRYLLSITFILFLIHLTRKMFGGGDD